MDSTPAYVKPPDVKLPGALELRSALEGILVGCSSTFNTDRQKCAHYLSSAAHAALEF